MSVMEISTRSVPSQIQLQNLPRPPTHDPVQTIAQATFTESVHPPILLPSPVYPPVLSSSSQSISGEKQKCESINAKSVDIKGQTHLEKIAKRIEERILILKKQEEQLAEDKVVQKRKVFISDLEQRANSGRFRTNQNDSSFLSDEKIVAEIQVSPHFTAIIKCFCQKYFYQGLKPFLKMERAALLIKETICKIEIDGCLILQDDPFLLSSFLEAFPYTDLVTIKHRLSLLIKIKICFGNQEFQRIAEIIKEYPDSRKYLIRLFLVSILKDRCPTDSRAIFIYLQKAITLSPRECVSVFFESLKSENNCWIYLFDERCESDAIRFKPLFIEMKEQNSGIIPQYVELSKKFKKGISGSAEESYARIYDGRLFGFTKDELHTHAQQHASCSSTSEITVDTAMLQRAEFYDLGFQLKRIILEKDIQRFGSFVEAHPVALDYLTNEVEEGLTWILINFFKQGEEGWIIPVLNHRSDLQGKLEEALSHFFSKYKIFSMQPSAGLQRLQKLGLQRMPDSSLVRARESQYHCLRLAKFEENEFVEEFQQAHQQLVECDSWIARFNSFSLKTINIVLTLRPDFKPAYYSVFFKSMVNSINKELTFWRNWYFELEKNGLIDPQQYIATFSAYVCSLNYYHRGVDCGLGSDSRKDERKRLIMTMKELRFIHEMTPIEIFSHVPKELRKSLSTFGFENNTAILLKNCLGLTTEEYNEGLAANR